MEFQDENKNIGIDLLLSHWDMEEVLGLLEDLYLPKDVENLYSPEDVEDEEEDEEDRARSSEEGLSQEETEEGSSGAHVPDTFAQVTCPSVQGGVQYGGVTDLLAFIGRLSGTAHGPQVQGNSLMHQNNETGVLLNKVREAILCVKSERL